MAMGALLALGLPISATAAIMLYSFRQYGLQPGPLLFERSSEHVWALLASFFIAMIVLLVLNLPFAMLWAKLLLIPRPYLYAGITVVCALGIYATSGKSANGDFSVLVQGPSPIVLYSLLLLVVAYAVRTKIVAHRRRKREGARLRCERPARSREGNEFPHAPGPAFGMPGRGWCGGSRPVRSGSAVPARQRRAPPPAAIRAPPSPIRIRA